MAALAEQSAGRHSDGAFGVWLFPGAGSTDRSVRVFEGSFRSRCLAQRLDRAQIATLAKIPTLIMFGDHLGDVRGGPASNGPLLSTRARSLSTKSPPRAATRK